MIFFGKRFVQCKQNVTPHCLEEKLQQDMKLVQVWSHPETPKGLYWYHQHYLECFDLTVTKGTFDRTFAKVCSDQTIAKQEEWKRSLFPLVILKFCVMGLNSLLRGPM